MKESSSDQIAPAHRRVRKRRFAVPRQALGLDGDVWFSHGRPGSAPESDLPHPPIPVADDAATKLSATTDWRLRLVHRVLWIGVFILLFILLRDWIVLFVHEAVFGWPSMKSGF